MVSQQIFHDKIKELENKKARMKTLVLCMSDTEEQLDALTIIDSLNSLNDEKRRTHSRSFNSQKRSMSLNKSQREFYKNSKMNKSDTSITLQNKR